MRRQPKRLSADQRKPFRPVLEASSSVGRKKDPLDEGLLDEIFNPAGHGSNVVVDRIVDLRPTTEETPGYRQESRTEPSTARGKGVDRERLDAQIKWSVTAGDKRRLDDLLHRLSQAAGTKIGFAHWSRALWELLDEESARICRALEKEDLQRPANQDAVGLAKFDTDLKAFLRATLRTLPRVPTTPADE